MRNSSKNKNKKLQLKTKTIKSITHRDADGDYCASPAQRSTLRHKSRSHRFVRIRHQPAACWRAAIRGASRTISSLSIGPRKANLASPWRSGYVWWVLCLDELTRIRLGCRSKTVAGRVGHTVYLRGSLQQQQYRWRPIFARSRQGQYAKKRWSCETNCGQ